MLISLAFRLLQGSWVFRKLDLGNAYLVWIREGDKQKTPFNTLSGDYEFVIIPFRLQTDFLHNMLNIFALHRQHCDFCSQSDDEHATHVHWVLERLLQYQLVIRAENETSSTTCVVSEVRY